jgi:Kef-type K+ transport system membrane component KefB
LVAARLLGELFERFRQPSMIGEILAGIILGPSLLNIIHRTESISIISDLGVFLLVIIAGLEIKIDGVIKSLQGRNIVVSLLAFFLPIFSGFAVGYFFDMNTMTTLFIGLCIAITALPVSVRILMDLGKLNTPIGQKIISTAVVNDVLALTILGIILNVRSTDMAWHSIAQVTSISLLKLVVFISVLFVAYYVIRRISKNAKYIENYLNRLLSFLRGRESLFAVFFVFVLIFATITESLGFHFVVGAFFAAILIGDNIVGKKHLKTIHDTTNGLAMGFLAPVFFAGIGLEFNFIAIQNYWLLIVILAVSYLSKILGGYLGGKFIGLNRKASLGLGFGLNARGIMELIIANIAYKSGLINLEIFSILIIMGILTTVVTPFALKKYL